MRNIARGCREYDPFSFQSISIGEVKFLCCFRDLLSMEMPGYLTMQVHINALTSTGASQTMHKKSMKKRRNKRNLPIDREKCAHHKEIMESRLTTRALSDRLWHNNSSTKGVKVFMDFSLNEEQTMLYDMVRDFSMEKIAPRAADIDKQGGFPGDLLEELCSQGLLGVTVSSDYDGAGMDTVSLCLAIEEVGRGCASAGAILAVHNAMAAHAIATFGSAEQKKVFLPGLASGKKTGAIAFDEPEKLPMTAKATKEGDHYLIDGVKAFVINGLNAKVLIVFALTGEDRLSCFVVDGTAKGLKKGEAEPIPGLRAAGICQLSFEKCQVPASCLLGKEGEGRAVADVVNALGHLAAAALSVGIAQASVDAAVRYSQERKQFGQFISSFYMIQNMLAQMATDTEAARLMVRKGAWLVDRNLPYIKEASMAKLFACDAAVRTTINAIQVHGGYGYTQEYSLERHLRDAKIVHLLLGTTDNHRALIAQKLFNK
jgi:acyl-CoA dehydrogenase